MDLKTEVKCAESVLNFLLEGETEGRRLERGISIIIIYNRELSADEVLKNFNAQKNRFGI